MGGLRWCSPGFKMELGGGREARRRWWLLRWRERWLVAMLAVGSGGVVMGQGPGEGSRLRKVSAAGAKVPDVVVGRSVGGGGEHRSSSRGS